MARAVSDSPDPEAFVVRNVPRSLQTAIGGVTPLPGFAARTLPPPAWGRVPIKTVTKPGPATRIR